MVTVLGVLLAPSAWAFSLGHYCHASRLPNRPLRWTASSPIRIWCGSSPSSGVRPPRLWCSTQVQSAIQEIQRGRIKHQEFLDMSIAAATVYYIAYLIR